MVPDTTVTNPISLSTSLEMLGKLAGLASGILLIFSIAYDFSFFLALGLSFDEVPTTLSDHLRSAIVWAPQLCLIVAGYIMYELFMRRMEGGRTEEELIQSFRYPRLMKAFRAGPKVIFSSFMVAATIVSILFSPSLQWMYLAFMAVWCVLSVSVISHPRMGPPLVQAFKPRRIRIFIAIPIALAMIGSIGYGSGQHLLVVKTPSWYLRLKVEENVEQRQVAGYRRFGDFAVVVGMDRQISIVPAQNILFAGAIASPSAQLPLFCRWSGRMCPETTGGTTNTHLRLDSKGT